MEKSSCLFLVSCSIFALCLSAEKAFGSSDSVEDDSSDPIKISEVVLEDDNDGEDDEVVLSESRALVPLKRSIPDPIILDTSTDSTGRHILTLDGGGQRGIMQTYMMALMEARTGKPIWQLFDLIAGTSAGGMGALMAVCPHPEDSGRAKYTMAQALDIMQSEEGRSIFRKVETAGWATPFRSRFWSSLGRTVVSMGGLTMPRYSRRNLEAFLLKHFGDARLSDALTSVMVSAYRLPGPDEGEGQPYYFKSLKAQTREPKHDRLMWEVAGATSAAPTFFDPAKVHRLDEDGNLTEEFETYIDGGVFANNPSIPGTAEVLIEYLDAIESDPESMSIEDARFSIISLGTGRKVREGVSRDYYQRRGTLFWVKELLSNIMIGGVAKTNHFILQRLFRHDPRVDTYIRWNPYLLTASESMDDSSATNIRRLLADARAYTEDGSFSKRIVQRLSRSGRIRSYSSLMTPRGKKDIKLIKTRSAPRLESQYDILARTLGFIEDSDSSDDSSYEDDFAYDSELGFDLAFDDSSSDISIIELEDDLDEKKSS
jgi:uncharacterized protein